MDKIIKTISESGAFRAFVLDSTKPSHCSKNIKLQASSTVALGRTLIAARFSQPMKKEITKITVKVLGTKYSRTIITVANYKGQRQGYVQKSRCRYQKTATGEVLVGPLSAMVNSRYHRLWYWKSLQLYDSLFSGEIGEDLFYLTESQQTPSTVSLNVALDEEDRVRCWWLFAPKYYQMPRGRNRTFWKTNPRDASYLNPSGNDDHIEALLKAIYGDESYKRLSEEEIRFNVTAVRTFMNALASLPSSNLGNERGRPRGRNHLSILPNNLNFDENDLEELIRDKS